MHKLLASTIVIATLAAPAAASAQMRNARNTPQPTEGMRWGVGAGLTLPMGNYSTGDKLGFHGLGLVQMPLRNTPIHLRFDLMFSTTSHKNGVSGSTRLIGADADALYHLGDRTQTTRPYILGGLGLYNAHVSVPAGSVSNTNIAINLGGGILFGIGATTHAFLEARYVDIFASGGNLSFIPITFGLMFNGNK